MERSRSTIPGRTSSILSTSSMVFSSLKEILSEPCATSWQRPMASRTWLGSSEPLVQAEPLEAQIPYISRLKSRLSPSIPSMEMFTLPGRRFSRSPLRRVRSILRMLSISLSRRTLVRAPRSSMFCEAISIALARPTIPATFSVPARLPRSWAPPSIRFGKTTPFLM